MATITPSWGESLELLALQTLAGLESVAVQISDLATKDIVGAIVCYKQGTTPIDGLKVTYFSRNPLTAIGTDGVAYGNVTNFKIAELATLPSTTVNTDSSSGQKTLQVAAITNFARGDVIIIAAGDATREEIALVVDIVSGTADLILEDNLANAHTAAQADTVEKFTTEYIQLSGMSDATLLLENLDTDTGVDCEVAVFGVRREWSST